LLVNVELSKLTASIAIPVDTGMPVFGHLIITFAMGDRLLSVVCAPTIVRPFDPPSVDPFSVSEVGGCVCKPPPDRRRREPINRKDKR
jgi:hypothetical protein